jgi:hypothetical protein
MKKKREKTVKPDFHTTPFAKLVELDKSLADTRRHYAALNPEERREAADYAYYASDATEIFNLAVAQTGAEPPFKETWPSGIEALAIDPTYAPALLTVGSGSSKRRSECCCGLWLCRRPIITFPKATWTTFANSRSSNEICSGSSVAADVRAV